MDDKCTFEFISKHCSTYYVGIFKYDMFTVFVFGLFCFVFVFLVVLSCIQQDLNLHFIFFSAHLS